MVTIDYKDYGPHTENINGKDYTCAAEFIEFRGMKVLQYCIVSEDPSEKPINGDVVIYRDKNGNPTKTQAVSWNAHCRFLWEDFCVAVKKNVDTLFDTVEALSHYKDTAIHIGIFTNEKHGSAFGGTMYTDGKDVYINPLFAQQLFIQDNENKANENGLTDEEKDEIDYSFNDDSLHFKFVFFHELLHKLFNHLPQYRSEINLFPDGQLANVAMDHQINAYLEEYYGFAGVTNEIHGCIDPSMRFLNKSWQGIYNKIRKENRNTTPSKPKDPGTDGGGDTQVSKDFMNGINDMNSIFRELCTKLGITDKSTPADFQHLKDVLTNLLKSQPFNLNMDNILNESYINNTDVADKMEEIPDYNDGVINAIGNIYKKLDDKINGTTNTTDGGGNGGGNGGGITTDDNFNDIFGSEQNQQNQKELDDAVKEAQEAAQKAQEAAQNGDEECAKQAAQQAAEAAQKVADALNDSSVSDAAQNASNTANDSSSSAQDAANAAQQAADAAQQGAQQAQSSEGENSSSKNNNKSGTSGEYHGTRHSSDGKQTNSGNSGNQTQDNSGNSSELNADTYKDTEYGMCGRDINLERDGEKISPKKDDNLDDKKRDFARDVARKRLEKEGLKPGDPEYNKKYIDYTNGILGVIPLEVLPPMIDWISVLKNELTPVKTKVKERRHTFSREHAVSKELAGRKYKKVEYITKALNHISFIIDRSGSIYSNEDFPTYFHGELVDIATYMFSMGIKELTIDIVFFDDKIYTDGSDTFVIHSPEQINIIYDKMKKTNAGGGTVYKHAFSKAYELLKEQNSEYCVIITDDDFDSYRSGYDRYITPKEITGIDIEYEYLKKILLLQYSDSQVSGDYKSGERGMINVPMKQLNDELAAIRKQNGGKKVNENKLTNAIAGAAFVTALGFGGCNGVLQEPVHHQLVYPGSTQVDKGGSKSNVLDLDKFFESQDWEGLSDNEGYVYDQYGVSECAASKHNGSTLVVEVMFEDPDSERGYRCWRYWVPVGMEANYKNKLVDVSLFEPFLDKVLVNGQPNE